MSICTHCHSITPIRSDDTLCGPCRQWQDAEDRLTPEEREERDRDAEAVVDEFLAASDEVTRSLRSDTLDDLIALGRRRGALRAAEQEASALLANAVIRAVGAGVSESEVAREAGVDRMTVRAWLGKR